MEISNYLDQLRTLVSQDRLEEVLAQLKEILAQSPALSEAMHQSGRLSAIQKQIRLGTVSQETATLTRNQIRTDLLAFLDSMEKPFENPLIQKQVEEAISVVMSKNVVAGSSIQAGGNVTIGDTTITESPTGRRLRYFSYFLIPILALGLAIFGSQYYVAKQPVTLSVAIQNSTPNPELPFESGSLSLHVGDYTDSKRARKGETVTFTGIPSRNRGQKATILFQAEGFEKVDTTFTFKKEAVSLRVRRDNSLATVRGSVQDEEGRPLEGVAIRVQGDLTAFTDASGSFSIAIPFDRQRKEQRVQAIAAGFMIWDHTTPVFKDEPIPIILERE